MSKPSPDLSSWRTWAAERLGVSPNASSTDAGVAFLGILEACDFTPPRETRAAAQLCLTSHGKIEPASALAIAHKGINQSLRAAVESFAQKYWSLQPHERQSEHERLLAAAESPRLKTRLESLRAGLMLEAITECADDSVKELAREVQQIYVLEPDKRAVRRQQLVESMQHNPDGSVLLSGLVEDYPEVADLERCLTRSLRTEHVTRDYYDLRPWTISTGTDANQPSDVPPAEQTASPYAKLIRGGFYFVFILSILVRLISALGHNSAPTVTQKEDFLKPFEDLHLEVVPGPGGKPTVEAFDQKGRMVRIGESIKRMMGSEELLRNHGAR